MGGAKNCPETPRQKMIGMMYLVLTAMLALNVSTDILNGFALVDDSLHESMEAAEVRNQVLLDRIEQGYRSNPAKYQDAHNRAGDLIAKSDSLYDYIHNFKYNIAVLVDGEEADTAVREISDLSNLDYTGQYAIVEGNGAILREKINDYRMYLMSIARRDSTEWNKLFATPQGKNADGDPISWEESLFEGMPVGASITLLTKIQNDIRTAQSELLQTLNERVTGRDVKVNKLQAYVIPESKNVVQGGQYTAKIILAGIDSTQIPEYYVGNTQLGEDGMYTFTASTVGTQTYNGKIVVKRGTRGRTEEYPFTGEYHVSAPTATISNEDLNVMYRDFDNRFRVSVPGVPNEAVKISVTGATCKQSNGIWLIRPTGNGKTVVVTVSADFGDGKSQDMGKQSYRVKPKPTPNAYFMVGEKAYEGGKVKRDQVLHADAVVDASYGPEGLLNLSWQVVSFSVTTAFGTKTTQGNKFSAAQRTDLGKLKKGAMVIIGDIKAKDASGKPISLRPIPLTID